MVPAVSINYLAVFVATVAAMALGFLWYGPLFGSQWKKLMGFTDKTMKQMKMTPVQSMIGGFVSTLIMSYILAHFVDYTQAATFVDGAIAGMMV